MNNGYLRIYRSSQRTVCRTTYWFHKHGLTKSNRGISGLCITCHCLLSGYALKKHCHNIKDGPGGWLATIAVCGLPSGVACCMSRQQRWEVLKTAISIYIDEHQKETCAEDNVFSLQCPSSQFVDAEEKGWDEKFEDEWEQAEEILEKLEFVVATTMCPSHGDRRSFIKVLHQDLIETSISLAQFSL
jgi:hypothetical protein